MKNISEIKNGSKVIVKVGQNFIEAMVIGNLDDKLQVKSLTTGREFTTAKIERIESEPQSEPVEKVAKPEVPKAEKKMTLLGAAIDILKRENKPMNTREMVKAAIDSGLWVATACKTPEQSLYGAIFNEMTKAAAPRIKKSEVRGKFELV